MISTRLPKAAARATATPWRCPPDRVSTAWPMFWMVSRPSWLISLRAASRMPDGRASGTPTRARPACASRGRGTCSWRCPGPGRRPGSGRRSRCRPPGRRSATAESGRPAPSRMISPRSGMTAPEKHLMSVDLPAPLSPMTAEHLARVERRNRRGRGPRPRAVGLDQSREPRGSAVGRRLSCRDPPDPLVESDGDDDQHADGEGLPQWVERPRASVRCAPRRR